MVKFTSCRKCLQSGFPVNGYLLHTYPVYSKNKSGKTEKARFNAEAFAEELVAAYDLAILSLNRKAASDIYLTNLYRFLTPMSRFRKDYDMQSFSYDIARLYAEFVNGMTTTKSGRHFDFGPARVNKKAIRILDTNGKEQFLATIRFF